MDLAVRDQVVVVEDERELPFLRRQLVEQDRQHDVDEPGAGGAVRRQRLRAELGFDRAQRRNRVDEEASGVVVILIERQPRHPIRLGEPGGQQRRFAEAGRGCHHSERPLRAASQ